MKASVTWRIILNDLTIMSEMINVMTNLNVTVNTYLSYLIKTGEYCPVTEFISAGFPLIIRRGKCPMGKGWEDAVTSLL